MPMLFLMHTSTTSSGASPAAPADADDLGDILAPPADAQTLLSVGNATVPGLNRAIDGRWRTRNVTWDQWSGDLLDGVSLAVLSIDSDRPAPAVLSEILDQFDRRPVVALFLLDGEADDARSLLAERKGRHVSVDSTVGPERLRSKLTAMAQLQPGIADLHSELTSLRALKIDQAAIRDFDEELQFAARLQRDFLPRRLPEVGQARFGVLFRPASMVSGDIYDIVRLDERRVGFYVVDAIGHGLPAALLTMFVKKALQTKRITPTSYEILPPSVALEELNADICNQELSGCQFCTAAYCVLDTESLVLTYARAGHPAPLRISADGSLEELPSVGPLLGIFPDAHFETRHCQLSPDDRVVLFTDGADHAFLPSDTPADGRNFLEVITPMAAVPRDQLLFELTNRLNALIGTGEPEDDVTVLTMDLESLPRSA